MISQQTHERTILKNFQEGYLPILFESFLLDRKAAGLSKYTIAFYRSNLKFFGTFCESQAADLLNEITPDFLRRFILKIGEDHNPGGVHAYYRTLRAFFHWIEAEEIAAPDWKNPMHKVKAPKVPQEPIKPVEIADVVALIEACKSKVGNDLRDKAILLCLLDTGVRAQECCDLNIEDVDFATGSIMIRQGKGRKPRLVFLGKKARLSLRQYLYLRKDRSPALFIGKSGERLAYEGLRQLIKRRAMTAGIQSIPSPHDFRRAFALNMLRNGANIFALQRLMGHTDLSILRRYLAQTEGDIHEAHMMASPVDNNLFPENGRPALGKRSELLDA